MKRIGILGGMSYESSIHYYNLINKLVNQELGGLRSADMELRSVDFGLYADLMEKGLWDKIEVLIKDEILYLANSCGLVAIATNTMHKVVEDNWFDQIPLPPTFVHIGDAVANKCKAFGVKRVALLGTRFTMQENFMKNRLRSKGLEVVDVFCTEEVVERIDSIIFDELCRGTVLKESRAYLKKLCENILCDHRGQQPIGAIILGCTELDMALGETFADWLYKNYSCRLIDSTQAHIEEIVRIALEDDDELYF